ncbi:MAG: DUF6505 family protein [Pseudomonadota bacterium]
MKGLRTIRFDMTDDAVFEVGAPEGEFAVSGITCFGGIQRDDLVGKTRQAFANSFWGLPSLGRSTFASVGECRDADIDRAVDAMVAHFRSTLGAPDDGSAKAAAEAEIAFACDLCVNVPINTVFTLRRTLNAAGEIEEEFRQIKPPSGGEPLHSKIWSVEPDA